MEDDRKERCNATFLLQKESAPSSKHSSHDSLFPSYNYSTRLPLCTLICSYISLLLNLLIIMIALQTFSNCHAASLRYTFRHAHLFVLLTLRKSQL
mmetsp:Transcript_4579/g.16672  ORF Transcript_4579/g.16672 Transcript_4579/m.16672 type:complete len:96 (-) Transcript_4579:5-292(-)